MCLYGTPIGWKSSKQGILAQSTCQAEYIAAAEGLAIVEKMGYLEFFRNSTISTGGLPGRLTLWLDSQSACLAMRSPEPTPGTRHYVLKYLFVRNYAATRVDALRLCRTELQRADALTKFCGPEQRRLLLGSVGFRNGGGLPP